MPVMERKYGIRILVDVVVLLIVIVILLVVRQSWQPFERGYFCEDLSIRYPYKDADTVSDTQLVLGGCAAPIGVMLLLEYLRARRGGVGKRVIMCGREVHAYVWCLYTSIGVFMFGCACSQLLTDVAKYTIGRLRPHFIDICNPDWTQIDCSVPGKYIMPECSPVDAFRLKEARLSFPSGHASFSAFTMVYLVLYLQARLRVRMRLVRPFCQLLCILIAFYTALSRVSDYKHHWSDVMFGSLLGAAVAIAMWSYVWEVAVCCGNDRRDQLPLTDSSIVGHQQLHLQQIRHQNMREPCQYLSHLPYLESRGHQEPNMGRSENCDTLDSVTSSTLPTVKLPAAHAAYNASNCSLPMANCGSVCSAALPTADPVANAASNVTSTGLPTAQLPVATASVSSARLSVASTGLPAARYGPVFV